ncbi:MAG: hypothetical protein KDB07_10850 [Planctomycetes bacterium]|nr:hypothetical protein [Planctomycetota bacterium]
MTYVLPAGPSMSPMDALAFSPDFFKRKFPKYIKQMCDLSEKTTVLELILADGITLDVVYFEEIDPKYLLVVAFTDSRNCEETFHTYVRYETILRINIINMDSIDRPVGFNPSHEPTHSDSETQEA